MTRQEKKSLETLSSVLHKMQEVIDNGNCLATDEDGGFTHNAMVLQTWLKYLSVNVEESINEGKLAITL